MANWLKAFGSAARPLRDDWRTEANGVLRDHATFAKRPMVQKGDGIVCYAAGTGLVYAAGTITSHPYKDPTDSRDWPWRVDVELEVSKRFIHDGVRLEAVNCANSRNDVRVRIKRRSHVQLSPEEYDSAVAALKA